MGVAGVSVYGRLAGYGAVASRASGTSRDPRRAGRRWRVLDTGRVTGLPERAVRPAGHGSVDAHVNGNRVSGPGRLCAIALIRGGHREVRFVDATTMSTERV